jgi:nucleoside phosphorylase
MVSRILEESYWECPRCKQPAEAGPGVCDVCGSRLRHVTKRDERSIWSHSGLLDADVVSAALGYVKESLPGTDEARVRISREEIMRRISEQENTIVPSSEWYWVSSSDYEKVPMKRRKVDVLILTALGNELEAVTANSGPWRKVSDPDTEFEYYLTTAYHGLSIAAAGMTGMGPVRSAAATSTALAVLEPKRVMLVGICAGIGSEARLGDVCVSDQIVDYDLGKVRRGQYTPRWQAWASDATLVRAARAYQDRSWAETILTSRPDGSTDLPKAHLGTVLSASKIVADENMVTSLRNVWSQAVGLEMEASGVAAVTHEHPAQPSFILIKGVCDYADASKNDQWQSYAADAAGRYAISLLINRGSSSDFHTVPPPTEVASSATTLTLADPHIKIGMTPQELKVILTTSFSLRELEELCFDLGQEWEEVPDRDTRTGATMSIIKIFQRRTKLKILLDHIKKQRPDLFRAEDLSQAARPSGASCRHPARSYH